MLKYEGTKYKEMMKNYVNEHRDYKGDVMETEQHKRRVRYSGTHPRSYKEIQGAPARSMRIPFLKLLPREVHRRECISLLW